MDRLENLEKNSISHRHIKRAGYYCYREYWPFGWCPSYRNDAGETLHTSYLCSSMVVSWSEQLKALLDCWRPVAREEQDWWCSNLGSDVKPWNGVISGKNNNS